MRGEKSAKKRSRRGTHIYVSEETKKLIKRISTSQNIPMSRVVEDAIAATLVKKKAMVRGKEQVVGYAVDRNFWYAFKLANTVAYVKAAIDFELDDETVETWFKKAMETMEQIESRIAINLSQLKTKLRKYVEDRTPKRKKEVNDETKLAMVRIMLGGVVDA